jgi:ATP-dependent Zn protease
MNVKAKIAVICALVTGLAGVVPLIAVHRRSEPVLTYSRFLDRVRTGQVGSVTILGRASGAIQAVCRLRDGSVMKTVLPANYRDAMMAMQNNLVDIDIRDTDFESRQLLINATPFLLFLAAWIVLLIRGFPGGPKRGLETHRA